MKVSLSFKQCFKEASLKLDPFTAALFISGESALTSTCIPPSAGNPMLTLYRYPLLNNQSILNIPSLYLTEKLIQTNIFHLDEWKFSHR